VGCPRLLRFNLLRIQSDPNLIELYCPFNPACHLAGASPLELTTPQRSQRETPVFEDDVESYQLPSHQLEVPVVLVQDSIANIVSLDLEPIPESVL
jgi:hypothetical protein